MEQLHLLPIPLPALPKGANWVTPVFSRTQVRKAGTLLLRDESDSEDRTLAEQVLDNWRSSHAFPLNTIQVLLRRKAKEVDQGAEVVQRLKRRASVFRKLKLQPDMGLERMQDIAGCRAVVDSVRSVYLTLDALQRGASRHKLADPVDYIQHPKPDGYRSIHVVAQYQSTRNTHYNKHKVEIQLRTLLQHSWSTAVETAGTFLGCNLKGGEGPEEWLQFFRLVSSEFAELEGMPRVPGTPQQPESLAKIRELEDRLEVRKRLMMFRQALRVAEESLESDKPGALHYYLLHLLPGLDGELATLTITSYLKRDVERANADYSMLEQEAREAGRLWDVVLVSASSMAALMEAYSNYFANTEVFLHQLQRLLYPQGNHPPLGRLQVIDE